MPVQPTPVIGQYEIHALLGAGGSAEVWRGSITLPTGLEQECALKRLKGELATRPLYQHRLKRELEIGLAVTRDHPNLVTTQTCEVIAGRPTIVMELVVGAALSTIDARLDFDMVRYLATEVLAALAHLADKGVVHRDLSPANILIDHQGAVRVGDFGMATWAEGDSWHGDVVGTEPYQAPEARAGGRFGCEADLYALGRILWELLTDDIDSSSLPRETPRDLRDVVNGLLAPQPRERWTASRALGRLTRGDHAFVAAELGRMARGEVLTTTKGAPAPDTRRSIPAPDRDGASARYRTAARLGWLAAAAMTFVLGSIVGANYLAPERRHVQDAPIAASSSAQKSRDVSAGTPPPQSPPTQLVRSSPHTGEALSGPENATERDASQRASQNDGATPSELPILKRPKANRPQIEMPLSHVVSSVATHSKIEELAKNESRIDQLSELVEHPNFHDLVDVATLNGHFVVLVDRVDRRSVEVVIHAVGIQQPLRVITKDSVERCSNIDQRRVGFTSRVRLTKEKRGQCQVRILIAVGAGSGGTVVSVPTPVRF